MTMNRKLFDGLHGWSKRDQQTAGATFPAPNETQDVACARWGIAFHSNSSNPRAKRWYRVARMVYADSGWFELYWHADLNLRGGNLSAIRHKARELGVDVLPGVFRDMSPPCRRGSEMEREL